MATRAGISKVIAAFLPSRCGTSMGDRGSSGAGLGATGGAVIGAGGCAHFAEPGQSRRTVRDH